MLLPLLKLLRKAMRQQVSSASTGQILDMSLLTAPLSANKLHAGSFTVVVKLQL